MKKTKSYLSCDCGECKTCYNREYYRENLKTDPDHNMTQKEIAEELGISQQAVNEMLKKAIKKFRKKWIEMFGLYPMVITDRKSFDSIDNPNKHKR